VGDRVGWWWALVLLGLALPACAGADDLSETAVTRIAPGHAIGSDLSGDYTFEYTTLECQGDCIFDVIEYCYVGEADTGPVGVSQTDGRLVIDGAAVMAVTPLSGAVNADGSFDVGGLATFFDGDSVTTSRVQGLFAPGGTVSGLLRSRHRGSSAVDDLRCTTIRELSGYRW